MAQTLTYPSVTAEQWGKIKAALASNGIIVNADSGTVSRDGVDINYDYAAPALIVIVIHAPWIVGVAHVASILDGKIKEQLA